MRAGWDAALKNKLPSFPCQTRAPCRDVCLLALVLLTMSLHTLSRTATGKLWEEKNQKTTFKKYYGNGE